MLIHVTHKDDELATYDATTAPQIGVGLSIRTSDFKDMSHWVVQSVILAVIKADNVVKEDQLYEVWAKVARLA